MFPEHVERRFLDPEHSFDEYFQLRSRRKVGPIKGRGEGGEGMEVGEEGEYIPIATLSPPE